MLNFSLFFLCTCFFMSNTFAIYTNHHHNINHITKLTLDKRQVVASAACGSESNNVTICNPTSLTVWHNDTDQEITWKYNNPKLLDYTSVDLYLLYQPTEGTYEVIKSWPSLERNTGVLVQHIDDSWYPSPIQDNSANVTWAMYFYICGAGYSIQDDFDLIPTSHNYFPAPQGFTLIQISRNTTAQSPTSTSASPTSSPSATSNTNSSQKKLPGWAIAVIVIAAVLFIAAIIALIWAIRKYNRKRLNRTSMMLAPNNNTTSQGDDEKIPVLIPSKSESNVAGSTAAIPLVGAAASTGTSSQKSPVLKQGDISSIHSSQQVWSPRSMSPRQDDMSFVTTSEKPLMETESHHPQNASSSILSSTDALMIADTFRQFMRKPDWNDELEQADDSKRTQERKKLGDELLERQLKKEGTQVQSIHKIN